MQSATTEEILFSFASGTVYFLKRTSEMFVRLMPWALVVGVCASIAWVGLGVTPTPEPDRQVARASELLILRRLHLGLIGAAPSLEEIRRFEGLPSAGRIDRWTERLLTDPRHHRYFARRLAEVYVGSDGGSFIVFREDRFRAYLEAQLGKNRPYDELVRELVGSQGLWTSRAQTNFVTSAAIEGEIDAAKLASRTTRAFLGQRIDCAQCHDHPFDDWSQKQFEGLAGYYEQTQVGLFGIRDSGTATAATVPFYDHLVAGELQAGSRKAFASWLTHPKNRRFARASVNRMHAIVVGRPLHAPVDDLPDPPEIPTGMLDELAADFTSRGFDLRHLLRALTRSNTFRGEQFPMSPLRAEQLIGSLLQGSSARTLDGDANVAARAIRALREADFTKAYGEAAEAATIQQALLRMNGKLTSELLEPNPFNLTSRVSGLGSTDAAKLDALYLAFLTRRPTAAEIAHNLPLVDRFAIEDVAWALVNSVEWSWNH